MVHLTRVSLKNTRKIAKSSHRVDKVIIHSKAILIKNIYGKVSHRTSGSPNSRITGSALIEKGKLKNAYKINNTVHIPWISNRLLLRIKSTNPSSVPSLFKIPTKRDVEKEDLHALNRFSSRSRTCGRFAWTDLCRSAITASEQMGILSDSDAPAYNTISVTEAVTTTAKPTNSGFPLFVKKNKPEAITDTVTWLDLFVTNPTLYGIFRNPCAIMHRFQPKDVDSNSRKQLLIKTRQVWCSPQRIIALEQYFFHDIIENVKEKSRNSSNPIYITGLRNKAISQRAILPLRNYLYGGRGSSVYSLDFSKYDSTLPDFLFDIFFSIIEQVIDFKTPEDKKAFQLLRAYSKYSPYIYDDQLFIKQKGIGSGSLLTNLFDSWCNILLWDVATHISTKDESCFRDLIFNNADYLNMEQLSNMSYDEENRFPAPSLKHLKVCGDDTVIYCNSQMIDLHRSICNSLGMSISVGNQCSNVDDDIFFLGRYWDAGNRPFNSDLYITSHIIFRSSYYTQEAVPFIISKNNIEFQRIFSICAALSNGWSYMMRTFNQWPEFTHYWRNHIHFTDLTSYGENKYRSSLMNSTSNWELF
jgi:hypothetical protein